MCVCVCLFNSSSVDEAENVITFVFHLTHLYTFSVIKLSFLVEMLVVVGRSVVWPTVFRYGCPWFLSKGFIWCVTVFEV